MPRPQVDLRSFAAIGFEWLICVGTLSFAYQLATWWAYLIAVVIVATRQHGLLMLYHDAVHGLLARNGRVNDALINAFVGVPLLLPVEIYRPQHLTHHRELGTAEDPERKFLYAGQAWSYRPLATRALLEQLAGDLFVWGGARTLAAWRRAGGSLRCTATTVVIGGVWICAVLTWLWLAPAAAATMLLLWFLPLLTLTQLLQKLRSFAEHSGGPGVTPGWNAWTYTWRIGAFGRLTVWPYHINYHLEHHARPDVPWHGLPALGQTTPRFLNGSKFWALLHES